MSLLDLFAPTFAAEGEGISDVQNPRWWVPLGFGARETAAGVSISGESALTGDTYFACVRNIGEDMGVTPFRVLRKEGRHREEQPDHLVDSLLNGEPNDEMSSQAMRETMGMHAPGQGRGLAEIVRDGAGRPRELWPIHPTRARKLRKHGEIWWGIRHPMPIRKKTKPHEVFMPDEDILELHGVGGDGLSGYTVFQLAAETLAVQDQLTRFSGSFFKNGTHAGGKIRSPKKISDEAKNNIRESWLNKYSGAGNAFSPMFLEQGLDWEATVINPVDAQFIEQARFAVVVVCRWFRMPLSKVQSLETAGKYRNVEHASIEYVRDTLNPWYVRFENEANRKLLSPAERAAGYYTRHRLQALMRGDSAGRAAYYRQRFMLGSLSANDIRELEDENPIEDPAADEYWVQGAMTTLGNAANADASTAAQTPASPDREAAARVDALEHVVQDATHRVFQKEARAVERALARHRDQAEFFAWANRFYGDQDEYMQRALAPAITSADVLAVSAGCASIQPIAGLAEELQDQRTNGLARAAERFARKPVPGPTNADGSLTCNLCGADPCFCGQEPIAAADVLAAALTARVLILMRSAIVTNKVPVPADG